MQTANGGGDATTASFITNVTLVSIYPSSPPPPLRQISYHSAIEQKAVEIERGGSEWGWMLHMLLMEQPPPFPAAVADVATRMRENWKSRNNRKNDDGDRERGD